MDSHYGTVLLFKVGHSLDMFRSTRELEPTADEILENTVRIIALRNLHKSRLILRSIAGEGILELTGIIGVLEPVI